MIIGVYKGAGYGQYALIDTFFADDDEHAATAERKYSSSCAFVREDDENHEFPKTMPASRFEERLRPRCASKAIGRMDVRRLR